MPVIDDLTVRINMKGGKESVFTMKQLKTTTLAAKTAALAAVVAFAKMSQEARKLAMNMDVFEKTTGLSSKVLERMSFKAASAGISLDNYGDTLQRIQQMTMDIARGQGNIAPFQLHGIGVSKDPIKVMDQISRKLKALQGDPARAAQLAQDFGLSNEMMYALMQGQTEELEEQWLLKAKDKEALVQLNREWYKLWWYAKQIGIRSQGFLAHVALPLVKAAVQIVKTVGDISFAVADWYEKTRWIKDFMVAIGIGAVALLAYLWPLPTAVALLALALEDVYGYFTGKDSLLGRFIEWVKQGELLKDIFLTIGEIIRTISTSLFGRAFTKKASDWLLNRNEDGTFKDNTAALAMLPQSISDFAKPVLQGAGGISLVQNNNVNLLSTGDASEDGIAAGNVLHTAAVDSTAMQNSELARIDPLGIMKR